MLILDTVGDTIQAEASAASSITVSCYGVETASGVDSFKKLGKAQLTGSGTQDTIYTVPASTLTMCSVIVIANTSGSTRTIKLWHVPNGDSPGDNNAILGTVPMPANSSIVWNKGNIQMVPAVDRLDAGLISLADLTYASDSMIKVTAEDTYAIRTMAEVRTDLSLNLVENTALSTWAGTTNITTLGTIATGTWEATDVGIAHGGTGQSTAQAAIDALSAVSGATDEHILTKDTGSGNAIWKVNAGAGGISNCTLTAKTANYELVSGDFDGFHTFTNKDAGGTITLTLLAGVANYKVSFIVHTAEELRIEPDGSEQFVDFTHSSTGGKYLVSSTVGSAITLTWDGTKWQITEIIGVWGEEV